MNSASVRSETINNAHDAEYSKKTDSPSLLFYIAKNTRVVRYTSNAKG